MSFGPQFAPEETFIRWGWDRIMTTTDIPVAVSEAAYPNWRSAFVSGDPRRERSMMRDAFGSLDFRWFWLEQSFDWVQRVIEPVHGWPYLWRTPVRKSLRLPKYRVDLLAGEVAHAAYQARNRANYARSRDYRRPSGRVFEVVLVCGQMCPAEDAIARRFIDRFAAGDGTAWPPFFPGDRTGVQTDLYAGRVFKSAGEIARCTAAAVEPLWPLPKTMPFPFLPPN